MRRRSFLSGAAALGAAASVGVLGGCSRGERGPNDIKLWGIGGDSREYETQVVEAFKEDHPEVNISVDNVPGSGDGDATSVITAVRGGTGPDLWWMDRFSCAQFASLGLLEPITPLIEKYEDEGFMDQYLPFAANELKLGDDYYGLPTSTDTRALFYSKEVVQKAGYDPEELDPKNGPPTLDRVMEMSAKITKKDKRGNYTNLGLIPWDNQGWGYTWSIGLQASYFDPTGCTMDLTAQPVLDAYTFLYDWTREFGYGQVDAFKATYEPPNSPPTQSSFLGQQQGFVVATCGQMTSNEKYAPKLDFGYTDLPVFNDGDDPYTWSGGFGLCCPKGSTLSKPMWDFMKFYCGQPGQKIMVPQMGSLPTHLEVVDDPDPKLRKFDFFLDQLDYSTSRPPFPVGQIWWESMSDAQESIKLGSKTPIEALQRAQDRVAPQMETFCPFTMPEGFDEQGQ